MALVGLATERFDQVVATVGVFPTVGFFRADNPTVNSYRELTMATPSAS